MRGRQRPCTRHLQLKTMQARINLVDISNSSFGSSGSSPHRRSRFCFITISFSRKIKMPIPMRAVIAVGSRIRNISWSNFEAAPVDQQAMFIHDHKSRFAKPLMASCTTQQPKTNCLQSTRAARVVAGSAAQQLLHNHTVRIGSCNSVVLW